MTRDNENLLRSLIEVAGNAELVQQALSQLAHEKEQPLRLEDLVRRIVELREGVVKEPVGA